MVNFSRDKELMSVQEFTERLAQTIFWCSSRVDISNPRDCLQTPELRPGIFERNRFSAVDTVAVERDRSGGNEIRNAKIPHNLGGGKLLAYFPEINLACGAAEDESDGFFDVQNVPAWDTWIAYVEEETNRDCYGSYLIAWIPPEFIELASGGINCNPEECLVWLSETSVIYANILRREGLLV